MRSLYRSFFVLLAAAAPAFGGALSSNAKQAIPYDVQQVIQVDYRVFNSSKTAQALKEKLMPEQLKNLEQALKKAGLNESSDVNDLTFALFRTKTGLGLVGIAQGNLPVQKLTTNMKKQAIKAQKYRDNLIYPMQNGMSFTLLDTSTMVFGDIAALKQALDASDGQTRNVNYNSTILDQLSSVQNEPIWSILDGPGTQTMMKSALGEASGLADYDTIKKRLIGSRYTMEFGNGVKFNLDVKTSDSFSASTLSSLVRAGAMYKRVSGSPAEKAAVESLNVDSSGSDLLLKFEADDKKFVSLLNSPIFQAVSK
ncbi:MAG TPA: hypothetical protein VGC88_11695 [Terriglobales bacterium]|jgi:hypothetical protein